MNALEHQRDAWTAFGLGVFGGVIAGLTLLSFAGLQVFGLIAIVGAIRIRPRPFGAAGLLMGMGGTWIALFARATDACGVDSCGMDPIPWYAAAIAFLGAGLGLLAVGIRRAHAEPS